MVILSHEVGYTVVKINASMQISFLSAGVLCTEQIEYTDADRHFGWDLAYC